MQFSNFSVVVVLLFMLCVGKDSLLSLLISENVIYVLLALYV